MALILDTGPLVALLRANDPHHAWTREVFAKARGPLLTCDAVLSEACFLLRRGGQNPALALALVTRDVVRLTFDLRVEFVAVVALFQRFESVPASLADACLIRMSELRAGSRVVTFDRDFLIYRQGRKRSVPVLMPF